jgi:hypothetical protein
MRKWYSDGTRDVIRDWFYFWRYIDPLPLELQAFILHDEFGILVTAEHGMAPVFDRRDFQTLINIGFPGSDPPVLRNIVSNARERIDVEIRMFEEDQASAGKRPLSKLRPTQLEEYQVKGSEFCGVGADLLYRRARQRFFFLLTAEQILHALTTASPQSTLDQLWYEEECALDGYLSVEDGKVHLEPPTLFSILVGIEASRIRRCEICDNYFWAGRKDKLVCSLQCGATKRKRQERKRYTDKSGERLSKRKKTPSAKPHNINR